jgi:hypothetical protein
LRDFLDAILAFIGSESLSDEEFEGIDLPSPPAYTTATYLALKDVINNREGVSGQAKRLKLYFIAKGVDLEAAAGTPSIPPKSNILVGGAL